VTQLKPKNLELASDLLPFLKQRNILIKFLPAVSHLPLSATVTVVAGLEKWKRMWLALHSGLKNNFGHSQVEIQSEFE
jgi:hypothetical protein